MRNTGATQAPVQPITAIEYPVLLFLNADKGRRLVSSFRREGANVGCRQNAGRREYHVRYSPPVHAKAA